MFDFCINNAILNRYTVSEGGKMTLNAFLIILASVFLHAGWNFISRASRPSIAFFWLVEAFGGLFLIPFLFIVKVDWSVLPKAFWLCFLASSVFESVYSVGLSKTYKKTDISIAYPLMRALPVLLVAVITSIFHIGSKLSWFAGIGMAVVAAGCFILPQKTFKEFDFKAFIKSVCGPIMLAALGTTGYTITDSMALGYLNQYSQSSSIVTACAYFMMVKIGICSCLMVAIISIKEEREDLLFKCWRSLNPYLVGIFTGVAYLLVLWAMGMVSNVSYLQAFRQLSLPLGVAMGIVFLHEKFTMPKVFGVIMIVLGLLMTIF